MRTSLLITPLTLLTLAGCALCAAAGPIDLRPVPRMDLINQTPARPFEGHMILRVRTNSQAQLDAMLKVTESVWSERTGVGLLDIQIQSSNLDTITKLGIAHEVLIEDLQAHTDANWNRIVEQERADLQRIADEERAGRRGASVHDEAWFANYKQLADINSYYNNIATQRPDLASMADIGDSVQNNDIHALTITGPDTPGNAAADRPVVLWHGATHAREWVSPMTVAYIASRFVDGYDTDPRVKNLIDTTRIVIVPVTNPDGYLYTWSDNRFWRKNRQNNGGSFGVDLNRNWGYEWGGDGASPDPTNDTYHGPSPFSEPETSALRDLSLSYDEHLVAHIDYHCYSQLILWPFGYADDAITPEPDRTFYDNLATDLSNEILSFSGVYYDPIQSIELYAAAGDSSDWFYGELDAKSLTFELRPASGAGFDGFDPPPSTILPTAQENFEAAKLFVERTTQLLALNSDVLDIVEAETATPVTLFVSNGIASQDSSTATIYSRIGDFGSFTSSSMASNGSGEYTSTLPGAPCDVAIEYYFEISTEDGDTLTFPPSGASSPLSVLPQEITIVYEDDMESNTGWSVGAPGDSATTGIWNLMDPQATDAQPEDDHTPTGTDCWVTDGFSGATLGANDVDGGATSLTSPMLDAIAAGDGAELVYWRWYSNDAGGAPNEDSMLVELSSDNGNSWITLETVTENANQWVEKRFRIADFDTPTDQMRIRFVASDLINGSIVEAGVDDLRIESVGCSPNRADINGDGELNFFDISAFLTAFGELDPIADFNLDGVWNFFDISAFLAEFAEG